MRKFKKILLGLLLVCSVGNAQLFNNRMFINTVSKITYDRPTYISHTSNTVINQQDIPLTLPNDVEIGDYLLILVVNDHDGNGPVWIDGTFDPQEDDFTFIQTGGDFNQDCHYGSFWRIADGTESATINVKANVAEDQIGFYIHIKGASNIGNLGANFVGSSFNSILSGVAGNDDDLGIYIMAFDGGDGFPFSVTEGDGWTLIDEAEVGSGAGGSSGTFGIKIYDSTLAEDVKIDSNTFDGTAGFQFRIVK